MAYDKTKDELVEDLGPVSGTDFFADIRSYDDGEKKLSVYRRFTKKDGTKRRRQVVRLTFNEVVNLGEFLTEFSATHGTGEVT